MRTILTPGAVANALQTGALHTRAIHRNVLHLGSLTLLLSLFFIDTIPLRAQSLLGTAYLKVTVIDSITRKPIPHITVTLGTFGMSTTTGPSGIVVFPAAPAGQHLLRTNNHNYMSYSNYMTIRAGDTIRLTVALESVEEYKKKHAEQSTSGIRSGGEIDAGGVLRPQMDESSIIDDFFGLFSSDDASISMPLTPSGNIFSQPEFNTEDYAYIAENGYKRVDKEPLSTFSVDVDRASYSIMRKYLTRSQMPPKDAVRVEELINYFHYDLPQPKGTDPIAIFTDMTECPWNAKHKIVQIALKAKEMSKENLPPSNLVFLIDVSGSMQDADKLPLVKQAFTLLVDQLRPQDRVAIVVYAGAAGLVLPSTPGSQKDVILKSIGRLSAGGSTAGAEGIKLAYKIAKENFLDDGNNRVILATDGDFNVGVSSDAELVRLIEDKREDDIFLTVLGFGDGNYKDNKMEQLADKGNGNYSYCDNLLEAQKVFVQELGGTINTVAKDVKLQIEFNPKYVQAYRLIGYENRKLQNEDFNNDKKDAGDMGAGHEVTALYEIVPPGVNDPLIGTVDPLKYQTTPVVNPPTFSNADEVLTVKFRYKEPDGDVSKLVTNVLRLQPTKAEPSDNLKFSMAVAEFGMLLRDSEHKGSSTIAQVLSLANASKGLDTEGHRAEFIRLVNLYHAMKVSQPISE